MAVKIALGGWTASTYLSTNMHFMNAITCVHGENGGVCVFFFSHGQMIFFLSRLRCIMHREGGHYYVICISG